VSGRASLWASIAAAAAIATLLCAVPWALTDAWGRPLGPRWLAAGGVTLTTATIATGMATLLAALVAAASRRWPAILRLADAGLWVPPLVVQLAIVAAAPPGSDRTLWLRVALVLTLWPGIARRLADDLAAATTDPAAETAAMLGIAPLTRWREHVWPAIAPNLAAVVGMTLTTAMLSEIALAFLGLGPNPPAASWGTLAAEARARGDATLLWATLAPIAGISVLMAWWTDDAL
jgi:peptide/nickel transport system permease protein